jgi:hypothetical protein
MILVENDVDACNGKWGERGRGRRFGILFQQGVLLEVCQSEKERRLPEGNHSVQQPTDHLLARLKHSIVIGKPELQMYTDSEHLEFYTRRLRPSLPIRSPATLGED